MNIAHYNKNKENISGLSRAFLCFWRKSLTLLVIIMAALILLPCAGDAAVPTIVNYTFHANSAGSPDTDITLTKPTGWSVGDLFLCFVCSDHDAGPEWDLHPTPQLWTRLVNVGTATSDAVTGIYWRIADGTEPSTVTFTQNANDDLQGWWIVISGVDTSAPIHNTSGVGEGASASYFDITGHTTTVDDVLALWFMSFDGADGDPWVITASGWTNFIYGETAGGDNTDISGGWGRKNMASAGGSTGTVRVDPDATDGASFAQVSIKPSAGATTTIGDGASPADNSVLASSTNNAVDAFTLSTDTEPETVTALTVSFTGTDVSDVASGGVKIWDDSTGGTPNEWDAGDTEKGSASFSGTDASVTVSISVDSTPTQYLVTYNIASGATVSNTLQGAITDATVTNTLVNNDTNDNTLTVSCSNCVQLIGSWGTGLSHTKPSGSDRVLIFIASLQVWGVEPHLTSVTYGTQSLTRISDARIHQDNHGHVEVWMLDEAGIAAASNSTFVVVWDDTTSDLAYSHAFFSNVNQTNPIYKQATDITGSITPNPVTTVGLDTNDGDMVVVAAAAFWQAGTYAPQNGFTEGNDQQVGNITLGTAYKAASGATETPSMTHSDASGALYGQVIAGIVLRYVSSPVYTEGRLLGWWRTGLTHPAEAGSDRVLIFVAAAEKWGTTPVLNSLTYGGQSLSRVDSVSAEIESGTSNDVTLEVWILKEAGIAAASGDTFSPTWNASLDKEIYSSAFFSGVDQTTPTGAKDTNSGASPAPNPITTTGLSTTNGDMVITAAASCWGADKYTPGNGFIEGNDHNDHDKLLLGTAYKVATGATETPSMQNSDYTLDLTGQVISGVVIKTANPPTTTIGDGSSPASKNAPQGSTNNAVNAFTLVTDSGTDTVTELIVTFSGTAVADVAASGVKIYDDSTGSTANEWDSSDTLKGTASFSGSTASVTVSISVDDSANQYLVTYNIASGATLTNTLQGYITAATATNTLDNNDTTDATLTVTPAVKLAGSWVTGTTHIAEAGSDRVLILVGTIAGYGDGGCTISSASYGGQPLTFIESRASSGNYDSVTEVWYLNEAGIAAASGSTFSVTWNGAPTGERYMSGFYTGVNQTTPIGAQAENFADAATPNPITTSALSNISGDMVIAAAGGNGRGSYTAQNGFTEQQEDFWDDADDDCLVHTVADKVATGSDETPSIQHTGMYSQQIIGFVLQFAATTTIGDGTSPANKDVAPDSTNNAVSAFTLSTDTGNDTVTELTVSFTGTDVNDVASSGVKIYDDSTGGTPNEYDAGDTLKGTASFSGADASVTVSISVDSTPTQYLVTYDIATGATNTNTLQGAITAATVTNTLDNNDTNDATLTIDIGATISIGDGTSPANKDVAASGTNNAVDAFTLVCGTGTDTVTALTVTFTGTDVTDVAASGVKIYEDNGSVANEWDPTDTLKGTASFSGTTASVTVSISVDTSATQYLVTYDIAAGATVPNTLQGAITAATATYTLLNSDTTDATLTISDECYFSYRKPITIDNTQVFGSSDHLNFPVLVSLSGNWLKTTTADSSNGRIENANGYDIIFKNSTGTTQLDHEVESYDGSASGGTLVAWVRIPTLSYNSDTVIHMYYGNSCISSSLENVTGVWNDDYAAIWHLSQTPDTDGGTDEILDSNNSNHGDSQNMEAGDQTTDRINGVLNFDGTNEQITIVANAALDLSTNFTVSGWFYKNTSGTENLIYSSGTTNTQYWTIRSDPADKIEFNVDGTGGWASSTAIGTGAWHHMAVVKDGDAGTNMSFYVDGQPNGTATVGSVPAPTGQTRAIGYRPEGNDFYWAGKLDEIRVSSTARLAEWIETSYNNQKNNSTFYIEGDEEVLNCSFIYRKPITLESDEVIGSSDLSNFPVLINLSGDWLKTTTADLTNGRIENASGYDIIFKDSGGTHLDHEIEKYDGSASGGTLVAWVRIPTLSYNTDTVIYMYYGNTCISSSKENITGVWNSNYKGVWHLDESPTDQGTHADSTSNGNTGTWNDSNSLGNTNATGRIDGADDFDGTDDSIDVSYNASLDITSQLTLSAWIKSTADSKYILAKQADDGPAPTYGGTGVAWFEDDGSTTVTKSYPVPAGSNRILIVMAIADDDSTCDPVAPTGVTYGGKPLDKLDEATRGTSNHVSLWYLLETDIVAAVGTNVIATWSCSGGDMGILAYSYAGVDQNIPFGTPNSATGSGTSASVTIESAVGELVIEGTSYNFDSSGAEPAVGEVNQTQRMHEEGPEADADGSWVRMLASDKLADDTSVAMSWDTVDGNAWAIVGASLKPVAGGGDMPYALNTKDGGEFLVNNSSTEYSVSASGNINDDQWYHITATYDGSTMSLYKDGVFSLSDTNFSGDLPTNSNGLLIGDDYGSSTSGYINGILDEVRILSTALSADWIQTEHNNQKAGSTFTVEGSEDVLGCSYSFYKPITIESDEVWGTSDHTDFPFLVNITSDNDLRTTTNNGHVENINGYDIIFKDSYGRQLDHEIEQYEPTSGKFVAWVRIPTLSYNTDTVIYMYYGSSCISTSTQNVAGVWDDNYVGVWHLDESPANTVAGHDDSTGNPNDGTPQNFGTTSTSTTDPATDVPTWSTDSKIDGADVFDGSDDYVDVGNLQSLAGSSELTMSVWFNARTLPTVSGENYGIFIQHDDWDEQMGIRFDGDGSYLDGYVETGAVSGGASVAYSGNIVNNTWYHAVLTFNNGVVELFLDGVSKGTDDVSTSFTTLPDLINNMLIASLDQGSTDYFDGTIDEVRISSTARSAGWIKTCYYNQKAGSTFYSIDPEENYSPTAVDLISFTATGQSSAVLVEWETAQEIDNLGFNLYRTSDPYGSYTKLNSSLMPGLISSVKGRKYTHIDTGVTRDVLYYYMLEDVDLSGTRTMHGPICVDWDGDGIPDDDDEQTDDGSDEDTDDSPEVSIPTLRFEEVDFGPEGWTPASSNASWVKLTSFKAHEQDGGIALEWETSYEIDNLGFHIYRELDGKFFRITPDLVPGSVFSVGESSELPAGQSYVYWDALTNQTGYESYWLDSTDLNGGRASFGPIRPEIGGQPVSKRLEGRFRSIGKRQVSRAQEMGNIRALREELSTKPVQTQGSKATFRMISPENPSEPRLRPTEEQWALAAQSAVKIYVREDGWYRVGKQELVAAGLSPDVDPRYLQLYADGEEKSMMVTGSDDGRFDPFDAVEFYGSGLDTQFTAARVYWLVVGSRPGWRVDTPFIDIRLDLGQRMRTPRGLRGRGAPLTFPFSLESKERTFYFAALKNGEGENFFGSLISTEPVDQLLTVAHPDLSAPEDEEVMLEVVLQGATDSTHQVKILFNYVEVGELGFSRQQRRAVEIQVPYDLLLEGDNIVTLTAQGGATDVSLVDKIRLTYWRTYTADNDVLQFKASGGEWHSIGGFSSSEIQVVDITDPMRMFNVRGKVMTQDSDYAITVKVPGAGERTLLAFTEETIKSPAGIEANLASSWHELSQGAEVIIIGHSDLLESVGFLKQLREQQGWSVVLVDVEDLYDEFNFGSKNPWALKDFLDRAYAYWNPQPRFVLLVGDASYDPHNYLGFGEFDLVPTKFVDTGHLTTASDDWFVDFDDDGLAEMALGRLPVESAEEAATVVSKIIAFEGVAGLMNEALLVADINDFIDFEGASADVAGELLAGSMGVTEILRGRSATARSDLLNLLNQGQLLVNYVGHGSTRIWNGNLLTSTDAWSLTNSPYLPFLVSMTCLNGFFQDPYSDSMAETFLKAERGGAVAVWTSSGLTLPGEQAVMNLELIRLLFNGEGLTIGEAVMRAKRATTNDDIRRTWILFGDPTLRLR